MHLYYIFTLFDLIQDHCVTNKVSRTIESPLENVGVIKNTWKTVEKLRSKNTVQLLEDARV